MLIWGFKGYLETICTVMFECRRCGHQPLTLVKYGRKFTLFFIPLFATSTRWALICNFCREEFPISGEEANRYRTADAS